MSFLEEFQVSLGPKRGFASDLEDGCEGVAIFLLPESIHRASGAVVVGERCCWPAGLACNPEATPRSQFLQLLPDLFHQFLSPGPGASVAPWQRAAVCPAGHAEARLELMKGSYRFQFFFPGSVCPRSYPFPAPFSAATWLTHSDFRLNTRCRAHGDHRPPPPTHTRAKAGPLYCLCMSLTVVLHLWLDTCW